MNPSLFNELLDKLIKRLPKAVDPQGSNGKWVNGWNDAITEITLIIQEEKEKL